MKRFNFKVLAFLLPIIIIGGLMEFMLRQMPNVYRYKSNYLDKNSNNIEVLFLGSSHSFFGLNPVYTKKRSFNASHVSQTLDYDLLILKKYENKWSDLKYIVLPISFFSLFEKMESSKEAWRAKDYCIYFKIQSSKYLPYYTEMLSGQLLTNFKRLYSYYWKKSDNIACTELGWGTSYNSKYSKNLIESGKEAAKRHRITDDQYFEEMTLVLDSIIGFSRKYKIELILFTPPAFESYRDNLDQGQINRTTQTVINKVNKCNNCSYFNFLEDKSFIRSDFYDADHMNEFGAKKLTLKIDSIIESKQKNLCLHNGI
ncbi:MAG: hypothetical protein ABSF81_03505 [Bacteroidales bacterium]|jgi:hypothetical protein